jgi:hypothetical protein
MKKLLLLLLLTLLSTHGFADIGDTYYCKEESQKIASTCSGCWSASDKWFDEKFEFVRTETELEGIPYSPIKYQSAFSSESFGGHNWDRSYFYYDYGYLIRVYNLMEKHQTHSFLQISRCSIL